MKCPKCGAENRNAGEWCASCGQSLSEHGHTSSDSVACPQCGAPTPTTALYCDSCGLLLATPLGPPSEADTPLEGAASQTISPKKLGDLIGETLSIYQHSLKPLLVIAFIAQIPTLISGAVPGVVVLAALLPLNLAFTALGQGAIVHAVVRRYQGHPVTVAECYGRAWRRTASLVGALFIIATLAFGIPYLLLLADALFLVLWFPIMIFLVVRWFFFAQAVMVEDHQAFRSLIRSQELVKGNWWRIFAIGIAFLLITLGASVLLSIPGQLVVEVSPLVGRLLITAVGVVTTPFIVIGATVVYLDLRARKEGYSLEHLASEVEA